jgi:hypothetical protein
MKHEQAPQLYLTWLRCVPLIRQLSVSCAVWNGGRSGVKGPTISGCVDSLAVTRFGREETKFNFLISSRDFRSIALWNMLSLESGRIMTNGETQTIHLQAHSHSGEERKLTLSCPSVCSHVSTRLPLNRFPWNLVLGTFMKLCREKFQFVYHRAKISGTVFACLSMFYCCQPNQIVKALRVKCY